MTLSPGRNTRAPCRRSGVPSRPGAIASCSSPATVTQPVRARGAAVHDLTTERHEPDKPRGLRPDLWGTAGEIPAVYPAVLSVAFAPDGRTLATGGFDNTALLWDVTDPTRPTHLADPL